MRWVNDHTVVELAVEFPERVVKLRGQFVGIAAEKVRAAGGTNEERIAAEHAPRKIGMLILSRNIGNMFGRVAGTMPGGQKQRSKPELIAILDRLDGKTVFRAALRARVDPGRSRAIGQFPRAADQIGVDMRFKNVGNRYAVFSRQLQIDFHVRPRIDDGGCAFFVIADQI